MGDRVPVEGRLPDLPEGSLDLFDRWLFEEDALRVAETPEGRAWLLACALPREQIEALLFVIRYVPRPSSFLCEARDVLEAALRLFDGEEG